MSTRYRLLACVVLIVALVCWGCAVCPRQYVTRDHVWLQGPAAKELVDPDIPKFLSDPNRHSYFVDGASVSLTKVREEIDVTECYNLKVESPVLLQRYRPQPVIELSGKTSGSFRRTGLSTSAIGGRLGHNQEEYRVILDTGYPDDIMVQGVHIFDNRLRYCRDSTCDNELFDGICFVPELKIGSLSIKNTFAHFTDRQVQWEILGIPFHREPPRILIGLNVLRRFKYIRFDNPARTYEISNDTFAAGGGLDWAQVPFSFLGSSGVDCRRLRIELFIANRKLKCEFDTGFPGGMVIQDTLWRTLRAATRDMSLRRGTLKMFSRVVYDCYRGTVRQMDTGDLLLEDVPVVLVSSDCPIDCLVGLQFFRNKAVILDFERNILWVERQETSAPRRGSHGA